MKPTNMRRTILCAAVILCAVGQADVSEATIQWRVEDAGNGHYYDYVHTEVTWSVARDMASSMVHEGMSGYLATITSEAENNFIIDNFFQNGFLGGSDAEVEGDWRWVVGPEADQLFSRGEYPDPNRQTVIYADWGGNEPNDYDNTRHGFPYPGEDYLVFGTRDGGEWNDIPGAPYTSSGFYVEFGGTVIPEPASILIWFLLALAFGGIGYWRRRTKAC